MGFIIFQDHFLVAIDESRPIRDRARVLRKCCSRIAAPAEVMVNDEVVSLIASVIGQETSILLGKTVLEKKISQAANVVNEVPRQLLYQEKQYDRTRKTLKKNNRRFPVQRPFDLKDVEEVFGTKVGGCNG